MTLRKTCPRCRTPFGPETPYEGVPIDRCEGCGGIWLDEGELRSVLEARSRKFSAEEVRATKKRGNPGLEPLKPDLPCAKCGALMTRFRYSGTSEIVLDQCAGHGLWFDPDELEAIQMAVEEREIAEKLRDERPTTIFDVAESLWQ